MDRRHLVCIMDPGHRVHLLFLFLFLFGLPKIPNADIVYSFVHYDKHFAGGKGAFVIHDLVKNLTVRSNEQQATVRFSPCGTFDVLNALAGLQTGAITDQGSLATAMKQPSEKYFQNLASTIGVEKLQSFLDSAAYGNRDLSSGLPSFWMNGSLQVSPNEQVEFLKKLYSNQRSFDPNAVQILRSALVKNSNASKTFSGRSANCRSGDVNVAWFAGYLKNKQGEYVFATSMESASELTAERIESITKSILEEMRLL